MSVRVIVDPDACIGSGAGHRVGTVPASASA